jgi:hypothetical protein
MEKPLPAPERTACLWKVIELVSGQIRAVPASVSDDRPGPHEALIWQDAAQSDTKALQKAAQADPRVDLKYRRIRHEDSLERW